VQVQLEDGSTISDLRYIGHRIAPGKPKLAGLPATYVEADIEADTLEIDLADALSGLQVTLLYTAFTDHDAITRSARVTNGGPKAMRVLRLLSASVDLPEGAMELLQLSGAWARERHVVRTALRPGLQAIGSARGASSHQQNPFIALNSVPATEVSGEVWAMSLVYSGNFTAQAEVDQFGSIRLQAGLNPFDSSWLLEPGESLQSPEAVLVFSGSGYGSLSRILHRLYRMRLVRGEWRDAARPILINNWEATYFGFDADKIEAIARAGRDLGIELMVLDDGWFGRRDSDNCSLGDWVVDRRKLPAGLADLVRRVTGLGMRFGLWFEPEMVSPDSDLYRAHPDWCLHVGGRHRTTGRQQLILDLSRPEVCDYVVQAVCDVLASAPITYVKWDMNRHQTEVGSAGRAADRQRETSHRYMLGLYDAMERITSAFPHVLFEGCSGGGGRFDPGILYYMPQTWTSDDTDAVERLKIQFGTTFAYPVAAMGSHVSASPNHQIHRRTSLEARGHVAMSGNFGYELDLTTLSEAEASLAKAQVMAYKELRGLVQQGDFYRLLSPFEGNEAAWMFVSGNRREALVFHAKVLAVPNARLARLRLAGLDPSLNYACTQVATAASDGASRGWREPLGGDLLMAAGATMPEGHGDFATILWHLQAV
jgi:alpha-galactosidase